MCGLFMVRFDYSSSINKGDMKNSIDDILTECPNIMSD